MLILAVVTLLVVVLWMVVILKVNDEIDVRPQIHGNPLLIALFAALIPILAKWLQEWLAGRLKSAEAKIPKTGEMDDKAHAKAVLAQALDDTPRIAWGRRALIRWCQRNVDKTPDQEAMAEAQEIGQRAEDE